MNHKASPYITVEASQATVINVQRKNERGGSNESVCFSKSLKKSCDPGKTWKTQTPIHIIMIIAMLLKCHMKVDDIKEHIVFTKMNHR